MTLHGSGWRIRTHADGHLKSGRGRPIALRLKPAKGAALVHELAKLSGGVKNLAERARNIAESDESRVLAT